MAHTPTSYVNTHQCTNKKQYITFKCNVIRTMNSVLANKLEIQSSLTEHIWGEGESLCNENDLRVESDIQPRPILRCVAGTFSVVLDYFLSQINA